MTQPTFWDAPRIAPPAPPVVAEKARLNAAALRVLARLKQGPATGPELCRPDCGGNRAIGGRLYELRKDGWHIEAEHVSKGTWRYHLKGFKT